MIEHILDDLAGTNIDAKRLDAYKKQYCGQLVVAADSTEYLALNAGKSLLRHGVVMQPQQTLERIMAVTPDEIRTAAGMLTMPHCSILTYK